MPSEFAGGNQASEIKLEHYFFFKLAVLGFFLFCKSLILSLEMSSISLLNTSVAPLHHKILYTPSTPFTATKAIMSLMLNQDIILSLLETLLIIFKIPHTECLV